MMFTGFCSGTVSFILSGRTVFSGRTLGWTSTQARCRFWQVVFLLLPWLLQYFYCRFHCNFIYSFDFFWLCQLLYSAAKTISSTTPLRDDFRCCLSLTVPQILPEQSLKKSKASSVASTLSVSLDRKISSSLFIYLFIYFISLARSILSVELV